MPLGVVGVTFAVALEEIDVGNAVFDAFAAPFPRGGGSGNHVVVPVALVFDSIVHIVVLERDLVTHDRLEHRQYQSHDPEVPREVSRQRPHGIEQRAHWRYRARIKSFVSGNLAVNN